MTQEPIPLKLPRNKKNFWLYWIFFPGKFRLLIAAILQNIALFFRTEYKSSSDV
jgi:hypothetical protein